MLKKLSWLLVVTFASMLVLAACKSTPEQSPKSEHPEHPQGSEHPK